MLSSDIDISYSQGLVPLVSNGSWLCENARDLITCGGIGLGMAIFRVWAPDFRVFAVWAILTAICVRHGFDLLQQVGQLRTVAADIDHVMKMGPVVQR